MLNVRLQHGASIGFFVGTASGSLVGAIVWGITSWVNETARNDDVELKWVFISIIFGSVSGAILGAIIGLITGVLTNLLFNKPK